MLRHLSCSSYITPWYNVITVLFPFKTEKISSHIKVFSFIQVLWVNINMLFIILTKVTHPLIYFCYFTETSTQSSVVETTECYQGRGEGYRGTEDVMPNGLMCQRWDSQYPHNHTFIPQAYPCKWVTLSHKTAIHSLTRLHALTCKQIAGWLYLCFPETWEKTTVGIQMAKNSRGASRRTQESAQCSAPTSRSATPKTSLSMVRELNSFFFFYTQNGKEKADFHCIPSREFVYIFIFLSSDFTWDPITTHTGL